MKRRTCRNLATLAALAMLVVSCGGSHVDEDVDEDVGLDIAVTAPADSATQATDGEVSSTEEPAASETGVSDGAVTLVAVGDSLTAGDGDDTGFGFVGRLADSIRAIPGREDVEVVNLGASGWDSNMVVSGEDGASPGQLGPAVEAVEAAVAAGRTALVTVLIGSNDLWYLYAYGPPEGSTVVEEDAAAETYRANLDRIIGELTGAGATVVVGLPDDQSIRPAVVDIERLQAMLPDITADEVVQMSSMAVRLQGIATEVAATYGAPTVATDAMFWADETSMADDGIHPNEAGHIALAEFWLTSIYLLL